MLKKPLIVSSVLLLFGCGGGEVDIVKNGRMEYDKSYTISDVFDKRDMCQSTSWEYTKDAADRNVVEYICYFKGSEEFLNEQFDSNAARVRESFDAEIDNKQRAINRLVSSIKKHKEGAERAQKTIDALRKQNHDFESSGDSVEIAKIKKDIEFLESGGIDSRFWPEWNKIQAQKEYIEKGDSVEYRKKLLEELYDSVERKRKYQLTEARAQLNVQLKLHKRKIDENNQRIEDSINQKVRYEEEASSYQIKLDESKPVLEAEIADLKSNAEDAVASFKKRYYADEPKIAEYFHWTVDDDGSFYYATSGLAVVRNGKIDLQFEHSNMVLGEVLRFIYENPYKFTSMLQSRRYVGHSASLIRKIQ